MRLQIQVWSRKSPHVKCRAGETGRHADGKAAETWAPSLMRCSAHHRVNRRNSPSARSRPRRRHLRDAAPEIEPTARALCKSRFQRDPDQGHRGTRSCAGIASCERPTAPGNIRTNPWAAFRSQFRLAFEIGVFECKKYLPDSRNMTCRRAGSWNGLEWGATGSLWTSRTTVPRRGPRDCQKSCWPNANSVNRRAAGLA